MKKNNSFKNWYSKPENKEYMKKYTKKYYKKNKEKMKLNSKMQRRNYDNKLKNKVRNNLTEMINKYNIKKILTLESEQFLFAKQIPEKKVIVFEIDKTTYDLMEKKKPKNVKLFFGDISNFAELGAEVDCIYLDFCTNWTGANKTIYELKEEIKKSKLFILTLTIRDGYTKWNGDYQFDLINKLQVLLETNLKVLYGEAYQDTMGMVTIAFEVKKDE
jgi:hypothetical protein